MLALQQHMQGNWTASSSSSSLGGGLAEGNGDGFGPSIDCGVYVSNSSSSTGRMGLSLVVRESAGLDNVFVGVTTPNQVDQRGLQVC
jgi:hypothetical protein